MDIGPNCYGAKMIAHHITAMGPKCVQVPIAFDKYIMVKGVYENFHTIAMKAVCIL